MAHSTPRLDAYTAVVVVDVQVGLFLATSPPSEAAEVIARINRVTEQARRAGALVVFVQHDGTAQEDLVPFTPGWQLCPDLKVNASDLTIRKTTTDAFYRTSLETELRARGIQRLVIGGYATEFCIDSTVRNGASKEFEIIVLSDAHTTNDSEVLSANLIRRFHNWCWAEASSPKRIQVLRTSNLLDHIQ